MFFFDDGKKMQDLFFCTNSLEEKSCWLSATVHTDQGLSAAEGTFTLSAASA